MLAKLEGFNPFSNSVKDRIAWSMIMEPLRKGELSDFLYEATSTNTGIALASIANILGKKVKLFILKPSSGSAILSSRFSARRSLGFPSVLLLKLLRMLMLKLSEFTLRILIISRITLILKCI